MSFIGALKYTEDTFTLSECNGGVIEKQSYNALEDCQRLYGIIKGFKGFFI